MKKVIALLLACLLAVTLVACGGADSVASSSAVSATDSTTDSTVDSTADSTPAGENVLRIGMECDYAPNNWQEDTASDTNVPIENMPGYYAEGYDVQVARIIGEALGKEVMVEKLAWDGLIEALNAGQIDMIIAGMADTAERAESIAFSTTYQKTEYIILLNSDNAYASATTLADFEGAAILGQSGTKYDEVIDQIPGVNHLTPATDVPSMLSRLEQKTVDGLVIGRDNADSYLETFPQFSIVTFADGEGFDLGFTGACVGLRKDDTALLEQVNTVLATLTQDDYDAMMDLAQEMMPR